MLRSENVLDCNVEIFPRFDSISDEWNESGNESWESGWMTVTIIIIIDFIISNIIMTIHQSHPNLLDRWQTFALVVWVLIQLSEDPFITQGLIARASTGIGR